MEPVGLAIGLAGLAGQLFRVTMQCYEIFSDTQDLGIDHDSFHWQLVTEQNRLLRWEKTWGVNNGTLNQKLDPMEYEYRYAVGTLARIVSLFASAESLSSKYGLQATQPSETNPKSPDRKPEKQKNKSQKRKNKPPSHSRSMLGVFTFLNLRSQKDSGDLLRHLESTTGEGLPRYSTFPPDLDLHALNLLENPSVLQSKDLVPGLSEEVRQLEETTSRVQQIIPTYRKLQWAVTDKSRSINLINQLRTYNDGLFNVLPESAAPGHDDGYVIVPSPQIPKWRVPLSLPVQRNHRFTGREDLLDRIHSTLKSDIADDPKISKRRVAVLHGLGGIGKSQISIEYAYRYSSSYTSVFLVDATSQATLSRSALIMAEQLVAHYVSSQWGNCKPDIDQVGIQLNLSGCIDDYGRLKVETSSPELIRRAIKRWLSNIENTDWLLVFDNYDDIDNVALEDFIPTADFGNIIITTRKYEVKEFGVGVEVEEIGKDAGISILLSSAGKDLQKLDETDLEAAEKIAEKLGYLPLALDQAGGYLSAMQLPLTSYLPLYETSFRRVASANNPGLAKRYRNATLFTTWKISFDSLPKLASELLLLCAFLADQDVVEEGLERARDMIHWLGEDDDLMHDAILPLLSISLAKRKGVSGILSFHPLVLEWARESLNKSEQRVKATEALMVVVKAITYPGKYKEVNDYAFEQRIYPQIDVTYKNITKYFFGNTTLDLSIATAIFSIGDFYKDFGNYDAAEKLYLNSLATHQRVYGMEHLETLQVIHSLGRVCDKRGKYEEALDWYGRAQVGFEKTCGKEHPETIGTVGNIAVVFQSQGKYAEALEWNQRALEGCQRTLGNDHPKTLLAMNNIAVVFQSQAHYDKAREWWARALAGYERILGNEHPETLRTVNNTAFVYFCQGQYDKALEWYQRALAGREKILGKEHTETMSTVIGIAIVYRNQGRYEEALEWYTRALATKTKVLGEQHPETLGTLDNIAVVYLSQGKFDKALEMNRKAVFGYEKELGPQHPETTRAIHNMALILSNQEKYDEALVWYRRSLEGSERSLGEKHPDTLGTMVGIAFIFQIKGNYQEAMEWNRKALAGYEAILGKEHPETLLAVNSVAFSLQRQGKYPEALEQYARTLAGREKVLGRDHPDTLHTYHNMALVFRLNGQYDEALERYEQAHNGYLRKFGPEHSDTRDTMREISLIHQLKKNPQAAAMKSDVGPEGENFEGRISGDSQKPCR